MSSGTLAVLALWSAGIALICRGSSLGEAAFGATIGLGGAAFIGFI